MGNKGITLSLSDLAAVTMLKFFKKKGFTEFDSKNVLRLDDLILIILEQPIVCERKNELPLTPDPYPIDYDSLAKKYDIDYYVVASRHWAQSGKPSLTVHATGNFTDSITFGGNPYELQYVPANPMRNVFLEILENPPSGFQVSLEATHHSPTQFKTPMFFAEVGSSELQWENEEVCSYLVDSIINGLDNESKVQVAVGFGGGHYCPKFSVLEKDYAFGHIAAKYAISSLTNEMVEQMIKKSLNKVEIAFGEKSLKGSEKKQIQSALDKVGIPLFFK
ncbi:D-aminoacyl-tRNA deacylase [Candidatus Bathyarchaeota archaeon]|nr:D-aminoacyl-tRNA deacylase [Candidatus Bathyarchaeota archaeon]